MKKILAELFGFLFMPAMLLGDYLTHHGAFIFLYDAALIMFGLMLLAVIAVISKMGIGENAAVRKSLQDLKTWRWVLASVYLVIALCYTLASEHLVSAALIMGYAVIFTVFRMMVRVLNAQERSS